MLNIGDKFGGGVIFYVFPDGETALVSSLEDQVSPPGLGWGDFIITHGQDGDATVGGYSIPIGLLSQAIGSGNANTVTIVNAIAAVIDKTSCARICYDLDLNGFQDWYLPSKEELQLMYEQRTAIKNFNTGTAYCTSSNLVPNPNFPNYYEVFSVAFWNGIVSNAASSNKRLVRAIRTAHIDEVVGPIKPAKPPLNNASNHNQFNDVPSGIDGTMEFSIDGAPWAMYTPETLTSAMLSGNNILSIRYPAEGINPPSDAVVFVYTLPVVDPVDPTEPTEPSTISFSIAKLVARFNHYAVNLKEIKHNPAIRNQTRFFHVDLEAIQVALTEGANFPALFLQTPDVDKSGAYDNMSEQYAFTYVIIMPLHKQTKAELIDTCKLISDKIYNRLMHDVANEIIPGMIDGSNEGPFGPVGDGLYGWAKSISISDAYNAELAPNDWEDLS